MNANFEINNDDLVILDYFRSKTSKYIHVIQNTALYRIKNEKKR